MSDIVERLRHTAGHLINGTVEDGAVETAMLCEAAAEIERLRAQVETTRTSTIEECAKCIPMNWLDPLLSGPDRIGPLPFNGPMIELLFGNIQKRILALSSTDANASALTPAK